MIDDCLRCRGNFHTRPYTRCMRKGGFMRRLAIVLVGLAFGISLLIVPVLAGETAVAVIPKEKTMLWNGTDFTGWKRFLPDASKSVDDTWPSPTRSGAAGAGGTVRCT